MVRKPKTAFVGCPLALVRGGRAKKARWTRLWPSINAILGFAVVKRHPRTVRSPGNWPSADGRFSLSPHPANAQEGRAPAGARAGYAWRRLTATSMAMTIAATAAQ